MKAPKIVVFGLVLAFILSLFPAITLASPERSQTTGRQDQKQPQRETLPKEIKAVVMEGLITRQPRQDIPFTIFKSLIFPVQGGMHTVICFRAKNADLGYAAPVPAAPAPKNQPAQPAAAPAAGVLEARLALIFQFYQADAAGAMKVERESSFPVTLQTDAAGYDPNKEEWYSLGLGIPYGKYTMAMVMSPIDPKKGIADIKKISIGYLDLTIPDPASFTTALDTTPIVLVRSLEQMPAYEARPTVHKGLFTYSVFQIVPNIENIVTAEDKGQIDVFFYILGAKAKEEAAAAASPVAQPQPPKYEIEVNYEVQKEDGSTAVKWQAQNYAIPFIDQTLPLKKTTRTGDKVESKDLEPGKYSLVIKILDKVSKLTLEKKLPFEVK